MPRVPVIKTYKLFINGHFPRSESGRSLAVVNSAGETVARISQASRKDLRDAVEAARAAQPRWAQQTGYLRGQILYRMAEMLEGRCAEFAQAIDAVRAAAPPRPRRRAGGKVGGARPLDAASEVEASIDRLVCFAGWCDKLSHVLGCQNGVAGPYYNFTTPEPTGVVGVVAPDRPALLGLISLLAPVVCSGNACVALASEANPLPAALLGEALATSDLPAGVVNLLTGRRADVIEPLASHREVNAISAANLSAEEARTLRLGVAENLKRVRIIERTIPEWLDPERCHAPGEIEPFVEMKTIWHPSAC